MARQSAAGAWCCIAAAVLLLVTRIDQVVGGFRGSYSPTSCSTNGCPSVSWTFSSLNQAANFTMTSSPNRTRTDNYFSFALANGTNMKDALFVIDCYEPAGTIRLGTSRNVVVNGSKDNVDDPSFQSNLTNTYTAKINGTLMCAFTLNYNVSTLATSSIYILVSEGYMSSTANDRVRRSLLPAAVGPDTVPPKKLRHFQRSVSSQSFWTMTNAQSSTPSSAAGRGQMSPYNIACLGLMALTKLIRP